MGGDETRPGYMRYIKGIPARTTFIDIYKNVTEGTDKPLIPILSLRSTQL